MSNTEYDAAHARGAGAGNGSTAGDADNDGLRPHPSAEVDTAPKIRVESVAGTGHSAGGELVSLCVRTGTQGLVTLVLDTAALPALLDSLCDELAAAHKAAEAAGRPAGRLVYPIHAFGVGELDGVPGVLLTLNINMPSERMYVMPDPQHALSIAQALIKQAGLSKQTVVHKPVRKLILPPGVN